MLKRLKNIFSAKKEHRFTPVPPIPVDRAPPYIYLVMVQNSNGSRYLYDIGFDLKDMQAPLARACAKFAFAKVTMVTYYLKEIQKKGR